MGYWGTGLLQNDGALDAIDTVAEFETAAEIRDWFNDKLTNGDEYWAEEVLAVAKYLVENKSWSLRNFSTILLNVIFPALLFEMTRVHNWSIPRERFVVLTCFYGQLLDLSNPQTGRRSQNV
jgi:hypothetical protein